MFKLPYNCAHFICYQVNVENPSNYASAVLNQEFSDVQAGFRRQRKKISNGQHLLDHRESKGIRGKNLHLLY